jgi:hypothetical protein
VSRKQMSDLIKAAYDNKELPLKLQNHFRGLSLGALVGALTFFACGLLLVLTVFTLKLL